MVRSREWQSTHPTLYQISEEGLIGNPTKLEAFIGLVGRLNSDSQKLVDVINVLVVSVGVSFIL